MRLARFLAVVLAVLAGAGPALAQSADDAFEAALGHWRAASWYTRIGNVDVAAIEADSFREKVAALGPAAPAGIPSLAEIAAVALEGADLPTAARALSAIGDRLAEARRQAGLAGFPDSVRAYRNAIERMAGLLRMSEQRGAGLLEPGLKAEVRRAAVATAGTAAALEPATPPRWAGDPRFRTLVRQNADGVTALIAAIDRERPPASGLEIAGLISVVRSNYYLLFLSYGY